MAGGEDRGAWSPGRRCHAGGPARYRALALVVVAGVAAGCGGGHSSQTTGPTTTVAFSSARVLAIGDSITAGKDSIVSYPPRLESLLRRRNPDAQVVNRGAGGQTTIGGRDTLTVQLPADRPAFVLIMEGTNDVNVGTPTVESAAYLRQMVMLAKQSHVTTVLATIPPQFGPRREAMPAVVALNDQIRRVAAEEGVVLAEVFNAIPDESYMTGDGFHPNDQGQMAIAIVFDGALARAGYPAARRLARPR